MDVLLINTPIFRTKSNPDSEDSIPPIGIGYIYTQLTVSGYECQFIDAVVDGLLPYEILRKINESDAQYVGLNVFSSNLGIVRCLVENVASPKKFLLGGPAVRTLISEIESWKPNGSVTVVAGDAELILPAIIKDPTLAEKRSSTLNIVNVTVGSLFYPINIDLPLNRSIFKNEPVRRPDLGVIESHIIASRGCLYNCTFCTAARLLNPRSEPRYRSSDSLSKEITAIRKLHPETNCIRVLDDLFLRDQSSIELAARLFPENQLYWRSMAHVNTFRDLPSSQLETIKKSGCHELFMGIESGNDSTLRHVRKPFTADTAYKTVCRILDAQISVKCYFIIGFPGEIESAAQDTVTFASRLREYADKIGVQLRISTFRFRPYHGTALYDELVKEGRTITEIQNRIDISDTGIVNPYDCSSGNYAQYDEHTLNKYMIQMQELDSYRYLSNVNEQPAS
ncbi:MAG: radical SAM protein [Dehalococcoidia bacterium]|jgi:radical SAM superfamily enzyme YgiQ (UPF0313 family)